jgi:hypothetical protein
MARAQSEITAGRAIGGMMAGENEAQQYAARVSGLRESNRGLRNSLNNMQTTQQLAQRGAEMSGAYVPQTPWAGSAVYGNVNPSGTVEYGPNQSTPAIRDRVANRYDPQSWYNATNSPGQIQEAQAATAQSQLDAIRASNRDPYGSRANGQYSPVNGAGIISLAQQDAARKQAEMERFQASRAQQQANLEARAKQSGMSVDEQRAQDAITATRNARYANYMRNSRAAGERPMSYGEWVAAGAEKGDRSSQLADQAMRERAAKVDEPRVARQNYQASAYLSRYGVPVAMPSDPMQAAQWQQSMAMAGNPYAMSAYMKSMDEAGQNYRENLRQNGTGKLTPEVEAQFYQQWAANDPMRAYERAYSGYVSRAQADGRWDANGGADRSKILEQAAREANITKSATEQTREMMKGSKNFGPLVKGAPPPVSADPPTPEQMGINPSVGMPEQPKPAAPEEGLKVYNGLKAQNNGAPPTREQWVEAMKKNGHVLPDASSPESGDMLRQWWDMSDYGAGVQEFKKFLFGDKYTPNVRKR